MNMVCCCVFRILDMKNITTKSGQKILLLELKIEINTVGNTHLLYPSGVNDIARQHQFRFVNESSILFLYCVLEQWELDVC